MFSPNLTIDFLLINSLLPFNNMKGRNHRISICQIAAESHI